VKGVYERILSDQTRDGWTIHYPYLKENEGWFVLSTTAPDGSDHYYRYHQDGGAVTGFALEWNNAAGNINAERIAVLDSAVLGASMKGDPFIDPPNVGAEASASAAQPATVPIAPAPAPTPKTGYSSGTGFFVAADGSFVTAAHVVADCSDIKVKADDGSVGKAARVATDTENDLALLKLEKVPARVAPIRVGGRLGEGVEAFGFPHSDLLSSSGNFTLGNITAMSGLRDDSRYLQMSAPVQAGNSGGPLLDGSGNLVGVVAAKLDAIKMVAAEGDLPQNVNFAVKSAMVAAFLDANRVTYKVGAPAAVAPPPADIADQARAMSGFVVCR
jgi:S1-C subfamily serine protease